MEFRHICHEFQTFPSIDTDIFKLKSLGVSTNRDAWVYGFSKDTVQTNTERMVDNFNSEIERLKGLTDKEEKIANLNSSTRFVSWSRGLKQVFSKGEKIELNPKELNSHIYRPFTKKWLYYDKNVIEMIRKWKDVFGDNNRVILVPNNGSKRNFACLMVDTIPDLNLFYGGAQGFLLYDKTNIVSLFTDEDKYNIHENITRALSMTEEVFSITLTQLCIQRNTVLSLKMT